MVRVDRAIFGDVNSAHDVVAASERIDPNLLQALAADYTDLILPAAETWDPYLRGFALRGHFVLTRTFSVPATRTGMVQTHALLIPLTDAVGLPSLVDLVERLPTQPTPKNTPFEPGFDFSPGAHHRVTTNLPGFGPVVRLLAKGQMPVWVGQNGFEQIVHTLWARLWPAARKEFGFAPADTKNTHFGHTPTIVWTLPRARPNWTPEQIVDQTAVGLSSPSLTEAFVLDLPQGAALNDVCTRLGMYPSRIDGLKRLEQYTTTVIEGTAASLRMAARLLSKIASSPMELAAEKQNLIRELGEKTAASAEIELLGLRNFPFSSFQTATDVLAETTSRWLSGAIRSKAGGAQVVATIFQDMEGWSSIALLGLKGALTTWSDNHGSAIWRWWLSDPTLVEKMWAVLPELWEHEADLVKATPRQVTDETLDAVLKLCLTSRLSSLHAMVIAKHKTFTTNERLSRQLVVDGGAESWGLDQLIAAAPPEEVVAACIGQKNERLCRRAGSLLASNLTILREVDPKDTCWQSFWESAVDAGLDLYAGINDSQSVAHALLNQAVHGSSTSDKLLNAIAQDERSELLSFKQRAKLWSLLPAPTVTRAVNNVARAWLLAFRNGNESPTEQLEPQLATAIVQEWRKDIGNTGGGSIVFLSEKFKSLIQQRDLLTWLNVNGPNPSLLVAPGLGSFVNQRSWSDVAKALFDLVAQGQTSWVPAVEQCSRLLSRYDRFRFGVLHIVTGVDITEWWDAFRELSSHLYPSGVREKDIWQEAGGALSDTHAGTGREQWTFALNFLQRGGRSEYLTIEGLLHQMREDFPHNSELEALEKLYLKEFNKK